MVRLHVSSRPKTIQQQSTQNQTTQNNNHNHNNNNNNINRNRNKNNSLYNNKNKHVTSTSSSTSSLNSNASSLEYQQQQQLRNSGGIVMVVPQQQQQQQQQPQQQQQQQQQPQQQVQQYTQTIPPQQHATQQQQSQSQQLNTPSDGGSSVCSLPASPPLLQQTATPPQGAQLVPPVCAVHHPQQHQHQQWALVAAMHQAAAANLAATGGAMMSHLNGPPPTLAKLQQHSQHQHQQQQQQHVQENGHCHGPLAGLSPSGSTTSSIGSSASSGGGGVGSVGGGGGTLIAPVTAPPPPPPPHTGPLFIQYPGEFYPAEYYIAPHPHEGICPQHPHHHQPICAMPTEYGKQLNEHNESEEQDIMYGNVGFYYSPTAVQMVSQNRPTPLPVPVQVGPQGQAVMQQYMNENGTLTHVVLSPQQYQQLHTGQGHIHAPFLTTNGTSHFYSPIPAAFQPGPAGAGPTHFHAMSGGHLAPQPPPPAPPPTAQPQQQPQQQQQQQQQAQQQTQPPPTISHSSHSPSPPNNSYHKDERSQRQHTKLLRKLEKQRDLGSAISTPAHSPSPRRNDINGHHKHLMAANANQMAVHPLSSHHNPQILLPLSQQQQAQQQQHQQTQPQHQLNNHHQNHKRRNLTQLRNGGNVNYQQLSVVNNTDGGVSSVGTSEDGEDTSSLAEDEEDYQSSIVEQLSAIQKPEVCDLTSRSAKIVWEAPTLSESLLINVRDLRFNVLLSDRAKECKYKSLYKGDSYDCIVQDLQPGQEYVVRLQVHYQKLQGTPSEPTEFTTPACQPDQPLPPKLAIRTKNSLHLRWTSPNANGAPIQHYLLEYDEGKSAMQQQQQQQQQTQQTIHFVEVVRTKGKQYTLSKLQPSTIYNFRLAAINEIGTSLYSPICSYSTAGNPPTAPKPPNLQAVSSTSMRLVWERRANDMEFVLQMLDRSTGQGYFNVYTGTCTVYECNQLRRASIYQFRLRSQNEAGNSAWSSEISYSTQPERPSRPGKPLAKGKIAGTNFRVRWDPPLDTGGAEIVRYCLELTSGAKFERVYVGMEPEAICERLQPGTTYQLRVACEGPMGLSPYSDVAHITSEAIEPAAPPPPYYDNPPGPYAAVLRLNPPDYNGGAPVLEFELQLRRPALSESTEEDQTPTSIYRGKDAYCVVKDLQPGQAYEVQVRAWNRIGAGHWSPWFRFSSAPAPPYPPQAPKVVIKSATQLFISWQQPEANGAPITEYRLESAVNADCDDTTAPPSSAFQLCYQGLQTSTDLRNLLPYNIYYFRLNASNVTGMSKWSPLVNARTPAAVPAAPQIKDYEFTANEVTLRWTQPDCHGAPITGYNIEYAEGVITAPNNALEYTVTKLQAETAYKFRVQAVNEVGAGPYSANAKFTTLPAPPPPPKLECTGVGHNFIKLKWGDGRNLDFTKFYVEMYVVRAKEFQVVYTGSNCMCKVNKLQECTAYTFRICASTDRAGVGDYSEEYIFTTNIALPGHIKGPRIAAVGGSCLMNGHAGPSGLLPETPTSYVAGIGNLSIGVPHTLEWQSARTNFSDRVEYALQYAIGKDTEFKQIYRGQETKFIIENLEPGTTYQFRVCPIRVTSAEEDLSGQWTPAFRYTVPQLPPLDEFDGTMIGSAAVSVMSCNVNHNNNNNNNNNNNHHHHHHNNNNSNSNNNNNNNTNLIVPNFCGGTGSNNFLKHSHMVMHPNAHHNHNSHHSQHEPQQHNSRQQEEKTTSAGSRSNSQTITKNTTNSSNNNNNNLPFGLIPFGEFSVNFAGCDDPHHLHHHHHPHLDLPSGSNIVATELIVPITTVARRRTGSSSSSSRSSQNHASLLASAASSLLAHHNPIFAAAAAHLQQHHQNQHQQQYHGVIRRYVNKLTSMYTNRKRFTDQEKAVLFMVSFLFFTFLFATIVKMFIR